MSTRTTDLWVYAGTGWGDALDITGYEVEALDGSIGKVDRATFQTNSAYVVVDTGPWIFGRKVVLPAGLIDRVDREDARVFVHRTKDEIKSSPEYDETRFDDAYRNELVAYYGSGGPGHRDRSGR
jgi:hypothetical protein